MDAVLLLGPRETVLGYDGKGDCDMDAGSLVRRPLEGESVPFVFTGVSIANARLFEHSREGKFSLNILWDRTIKLGRVYGLRHDGIWMHVGTPEAVHEAEECIAREQG